MLKRIAICTLVTTATLVASVASADPGNGRYQRSAAYRPGSPEYDYARVTHVQPIVRRVRVTSPVRECWDETRYQEARGTDTTARTILGGAIGGVIGHQIGDGRGKDIATAAGAIIGSVIGHRSAVRHTAVYGEPREYTVERCEVRHETAYEERVEGYDVEYRYNGRTFNTRMPYDPGERVRVRVDVTPTYARY